MRRAAISISKNLSEGYGRNKTGEYIQFVGISIGSSCELDTQLEMAGRLSYIPADRIEALQDERGQIFAMLSGLKRALEGKRKSWLSLFTWFL